MTDDAARIIYLGLLLVAVGGFLFVEFGRSLGAAARRMLAWGLIFVGLIAAYGLWDDVQSRTAPSQIAVTPTRIEVPLGNDGHFQLVAELNDTPVRFVVDTGASSLALTERDARRIGIDPDELVFAGSAQTANGVVETATVRLDSIRIGDIVDHGVPAVVIRGDLGVSLMGMDYLRRFARVGFEGRTLVLER